MVNKKIFYCDELNKDIALKLSIEAMKFFHRHKTYYELYCIDIKKGEKKLLKKLIRRIYETFIEDEEDNKSNDDTNEEDKNDNKQKNCFILIYNCNILDLFDIDIYSVLKCNSSFIIVYDNKKLFNAKKIGTQKKEIKEKEFNLNYFFNIFGSENIELLDEKFINSNNIKDENGNNLNLKNLKSYLINKKLEVFKNGNLYQYIKNLNIFNKKEFSSILEEEEIKLIFCKILKIVENIHNKKLYNLNLELSNIMLDEKYNPILINFGSAKKCGEKLNYSDIIINEYSPPELYSQHLKYDEFKIDMYNLGIILFMLYFGIAPFAIPLNKNDLYYNIQNNNNLLFWDKIENKNNLKVNEDFKYLFSKLVSDNPNDRYSIEDIYNSKWMKEMTELFNTKPKKLYDIETQVYNKFEKIKMIKKRMNKKVYLIKENNFKLDKCIFKFENRPQKSNLNDEYNNIIQINLFIDPNDLMNELCKFLISKNPEISNIIQNKDKFEIIISENNDNKSDENNKLNIKYSIRLYQNINNYYNYFLKINYINGNISSFYSRQELLREHINFLSKNKNIIKIIYKKNESNQNKEINIFGENFVLKNKNRCKIIYNNKEYELQSKFKIKNGEQLIIHLIMNNNLIHMTEMFFECKDLISLPDIYLIDSTKVTDMAALFYGCESLESLPDISKWNISNVIEMSCLFCNCSSLKSLPDISKWNTKNVKNMNSLFNNCSSLISLPDISKWDISNVISMNSAFSECSSLESLPDISKWNIKNVYVMNSLFSGCSKLKSLPDISKWNTSNVKDISKLFSKCISLTYLPDLSTWNTNNIVKLNSLFFQCSSLKYLPDISKWNTINVIDMSYLFYKCSSLLSLPNLSKWNTSKVKSISLIFSECSSLESLPDISNWRTDNLKDMSFAFSSCKSLISLPDISKWNTSNVRDMTSLFSECISLKFLPDISIWNISNVRQMNKIFNHCMSITSLPDISKWNTSNVINMSSLFYNCSSLISLPDIFKWDINKGKNKRFVFNGCTSLISLPDISKWNNFKSIYIDEMFDECVSILKFPDNCILRSNRRKANIIS